MPETIKSFSNRCRCCLEKFYDDEKISKITSFFSFQFASFTSMKVSFCSSLFHHLLHFTIGNTLDSQLGESDLLSKHVCEFCHSELLRFSVFKKDLIEVKVGIKFLLNHLITRLVLFSFLFRNNKS